MITTKDLETIMTGGIVYSGDGQGIGTACEIYFDLQSGEPAVARVSNDIPFTTDILLPLQAAKWKVTPFTFPSRSRTSWTPPL